MSKYIFLLLFLIVLAFLSLKKNPEPQIVSQELPTPTQTITPSPAADQLFPPVAGDFRSRITKKSFGTYVDPQNSPVSPEHFRGYHTAVDIEYTDTTDDVPVFSIADGKVIFSGYAQGYGGVVLITHEFHGQEITSVYGHLRPSNMIKLGSTVKRGQGIGVLGTGYTSETDNERKHLHFGIIKGRRNLLLGYVQKQSELSNWIDPLTLF